MKWLRMITAGINSPATLRNGAETIMGSKLKSTWGIRGKESRQDRVFAAFLSWIFSPIIGTFLIGCGGFLYNCISYSWRFSNWWDWFLGEMITIVFFSLIYPFSIFPIAFCVTLLVVIPLMIYFPPPKRRFLSALLGACLGVFFVGISHLSSLPILIGLELVVLTPTTLIEGRYPAIPLLYYAAGLYGAIYGFLLSHFFSLICYYNYEVDQVA